MVSRDRDHDDRVTELTRKLDTLLDGIGQELAISSDPLGSGVASARSGMLYNAITRHWPRIAVGLVGFAALLDFVVGNLSVGGSLEFYVFAWASTTGGLWVMFEKAEKSLSATSRATVARWLRQSDLKSSIGSISAQFAMLFDKVFGERHFTLSSFARSSAASIVAIGLMSGLWLAVFSPVAEFSFQNVGDRAAMVGVPPSLVAPMVASGVDWEPVGYLLVDIFGFAGEAASVLVLALLFNLIPDYLSLWETRAVLGWMAKKGAHTRAIFLDLILTVGISIAAVFFGSWFFYGENPLPSSGVSVQSGWGAVPAPPDFYLDPDCSSGFRGACDRAELGSWGRNITYPDGTVARTGHMLREVITLEPRLGAVLIRVVPTVSRLVIDDGALERWPGLEAPELGARYGSYRVQSIEESRPSDTGRIVTLETDRIGLPFGLFFYSAFFTSVWLWLYAASVLVSRVLLRMNSGVGFLLRVTDVERQPFRSMGFVSVSIVSVLFALGLPLVLL
jgi:hypothetical protein